MTHCSETLNLHRDALVQKRSFPQIITRFAQCAESVIKRLSVRLSVCMSRRPTAAAAAGGLADEVGRSIAAAASRHAGRVNFGRT